MLTGYDVEKVCGPWNETTMTRDNESERLSSCVVQDLKKIEKFYERSESKMKIEHFVWSVFKIAKRNLKVRKTSNTDDYHPL
jgi:hypothetical protein